MNEKKIDHIRARRFPMGICDIIVISAAIILTVVLSLTVLSHKGSGVEIAYPDGKIVLSLSENTTRRISDCLTVTVSDGYVSVTESDCKNQTCVKTGKIHRVGESIVCAQNRIVITVIGNNGLAGSVGKG